MVTQSLGNPTLRFCASEAVAKKIGATLKKNHHSRINTTVIYIDSAPSACHPLYRAISLCGLEIISICTYFDHRAMADFLLFEGPIGYSLFKVVHQADTVGNKLKEVQDNLQDLAKFGKMVELTSFLPFEYVFQPQLGVFF